VQNVKKTKVIAYLICSGLLLLCSVVTAAEKVESQRPTASKLLDKYAQTQDMLRSSFISKLEIHTKFEAAAKARPNIRRGKVYENYRRMELRSDGERNYSYIKMWGDRPGLSANTEANASHLYKLWDGNVDYQYTYSPESHYKNGTVKLRYKRPERVNYFWQGAKGRTLRGYFPGVSERIDSELRQARTISVAPLREDINGSKCYIINATTKKCEYKLWIDPEHGYNIARAIVKRDWATWNRPERRPNAPKGSAEIQLRNVSFKNIGGVWLPVEADYRRNHRYVTGDYGKTYAHYRITEFIVKPDHDAIGSFKTDFIRNGARVRILGINDITYQWQNGKIVDKAGHVILYPKTEKPGKTKR
jgi:hypothetical protein